jgi:hypothetical protein
LSNPSGTDDFDIDAFLAGGSTQPQAPPNAPHQPATWDAQNRTMVGFMVEHPGSIKCLDPAFPSEFSSIAGSLDFASTKDKPGQTHFTWAKGGDVRLTCQTILSLCANNAQAYMDNTIEPLLNSFGFEPVVQGVYK